MGWETSKPHRTGKGQRKTLGSVHTDFFARDDRGKRDKSAGKGKISGVSRKETFLDSLSRGAKQAKKEMR